MGGECLFGFGVVGLEYDWMVLWVVIDVEWVFYFEECVFVVDWV